MSILDEINSCVKFYAGLDEDISFLAHEGVGHEDGGHSGRYPWGSGKNPFQHVYDFLADVKQKRDSGYSWVDPETGKTFTGDTAIAKSYGLSTGQFRIQMSLAEEDIRTAKVVRVKKLKAEGLSNMEIGRRMGINESSVRSLLDEDRELRMNKARNTAEFIKKHVEESNMPVDVSVGIERELGVSKEKLNEALYILEFEGYPNYTRGIKQVTNPTQQINTRVVCPKGTAYKDIYNDKNEPINIHYMTDYMSPDNGETFKPKFVYPSSMDSKRLEIKYNEEGGLAKDGVIEVRRGVKDLYLGDGVNYSQVRILVDGTHYLKGMAMYADDLPDGIDVRFNTNKLLGTPLEKVLKPIKQDDPSNPFNSLIKEDGGQSYYQNDKGEWKLSLINKTREEGDWNEWARKVPSQFLSKQSTALIKRQLDISTEEKLAEFDDIKSLTNPTIKRHLLQSFADDCDASAVHLKAAPLPGQRFQVILPVTNQKDTEVFAPNYNNGDKVALVRYPHGGIFEIPILTVNNKNPEALRTIGKNAKDAVGITKPVADRLSGADYDGDTVMVIPIKNGIRISTKPPLPGLEGFDPQVEYPERKGMRYMKDTQKQMGVISNLITDMTLKGASDDELARAVRHSMVVIDAEKHKLDWKRSEIDNGIDELKREYQGHIGEDGKYHEGAATLISGAKSQVRVPKRQGSAKIAEDGSLYYKTAPDATYIDKRTGKVVNRTTTSTRMAEAKDAMELVSDFNTATEITYAKYANRMKSLANEARLEMLSTGRLKYNREANKKYRDEVDALDHKLALSEANAPRERQAQTIATNMVSALKKENPDLERKDRRGELKKIEQRKLVYARQLVGAARHPISITDKEWEAIQAGAVTDNTLVKILKYADADDLRKKATPRTNGSDVTPSKISFIKSLAASGHTQAEIAERLGISVSTVNQYI